MSVPTGLNLPVCLYGMNIQTEFSLGCTSVKR